MLECSVPSTLTFHLDIPYLHLILLPWRVSDVLLTNSSKEAFYWITMFSLFFKAMRRRVHFNVIINNLGGEYHTFYSLFSANRTPCLHQTQAKTLG